MFPDRLVEGARKIPEKVASSLDPMMNRNTMLTYGGVGGFAVLKVATEILYQTDLVSPHYLITLITTLPFAYPIFKGAIGNAKEYFFSGKALSLAESQRDRVHMITAGLVGLHFAGEYAQTLAYILGGPDFGGMYSHDWNKFLFDPHMIPYWSLNMPGFFLMGKVGVSSIKGCFNDVIETVQTVRYLAKHKQYPPDYLKDKK